MGLSSHLFGACIFAPPGRAVNTVHVELDLFSGRENPCWDLGQVDAAHLRARKELLQPGRTGVPPVPDGLGYRGLQVTANFDGIEQRLKIGAGVVVLEAADGEGQRYFRDPDRDLEKWLLHTGQKHVGIGLIEFLLGE